MGEWRVGCLCGWGEDQGNWFLTKCVLDLIQQLHFSPLLYLHWNHLRWVNFRGQPSCEKMQLFFVHLWLSVASRPTVDTSVLSLLLCHCASGVLGGSNPWCYLRFPFEVSRLCDQALSLSLLHTRSSQLLLTLGSEGKHSDDSQYPRQHSSVNI